MTQPTTRRDINMAELRRLIPRLARLIESEEVLDAVAAKILDRLSEIDISDLSDPQRTACGASPPGTEPGPQDTGSPGRIPRVSAGAGDPGIVMLPGQVVYSDDLKCVDFILVADLLAILDKHDPDAAEHPDEFDTEFDEELDDAIERFLWHNPKLGRQTLLMNERLFSADAIAAGNLDRFFEAVELGEWWFYYVRESKP